MSRSFLGSTRGMLGLGFLSCPSIILFRGLSFGGLLTIILAMSPLVNGIGADGPLTVGGGGGGGGGGGILQGGEVGLAGVGSGVGGGGGKSWVTGSGSSMPIWLKWFAGAGTEWWLGKGLLDRLPFLFSKCAGMEPETKTNLNKLFD